MHRFQCCKLNQCATRRLLAWLLEFNPNREGPGDSRSCLGEPLLFSKAAAPVVKHQGFKSPPAVCLCQVNGLKEVRICRVSPIAVLERGGVGIPEPACWFWNGVGIRIRHVLLKHRYCFGSRFIDFGVQRLQLHRI